MIKNNNFKEMSKEVYYTTDDIAKLSKKDFSFLKKKLVDNNLRRIRVCTHKDVKDKIHEMFIVLKKNAYIRPHKHLNKDESFHLIEGSGKVIIFKDNGKIKDVIEISDYESGQRFYYKLDKPYYHTLLVTSKFLVFHETKQGPFIKSDMVFADWSPDEQDKTEVKKYVEKLEADIN